MNNKLGDLNNYLFECLERINDDDLNDEELKKELEKSKTVCQVADKIIELHNTILDAQKVLLENSRSEVNMQPLIDMK